MKAEVKCPISAIYVLNKTTYHPKRLPAINMMKPTRAAMLMNRCDEKKGIVRGIARGIMSIKMEKAIPAVHSQHQTSPQPESFMRFVLMVESP